MQPHRLLWLDIAKALGIIAVVSGHVSLNHGAWFHFVYWWHMPIFFLIGGFFLKPVARPKWPLMIKRRLWPLIISYLIYGSLLIMLSHYVRQQSWHYTFFYFVRLIYGGRTLNHYLSAFWYIPVFGMSILVTTLIISLIKTNHNRLIIALGSLFIGTSYKTIHFFQYKYLPWDLDITLIAVFFMLTGYLSFGTIVSLIKHVSVTIIGGGILLFFFWQQCQGTFNLGLFLKSHQLHSAPLEINLAIIIIPLLACLVIFGLSYWLSFLPKPIVTILAYLGQNTMPIMYTHKALLDICQKINITTLPMMIFNAITLPLLFTLMIKYWQHHSSQRLNIVS